MLRLYNTLSRTVEEFQPIDAQNVRIYACGPTVYDYQHIGHMRRYTNDDILLRILRFDGYKVKYVMNITDVGHLTSDEDNGEDKMEKGSEKYGTSVFDLAKKFEEQFLKDIKLLNIQMPDTLLRATEHIKEQIELIEILEEKDFTYKTSDGVYFDTEKFKDYNKLSKQPLEEIKPGVRVSLGKKRSVTDFALWKFSPKDKKRQMEWESPWGKGFPGWHIECSAMSIKALGPSFDIHTGGVDHINIHHTNEIAQSEAASGKKFVNFWVHHNFLIVENEKMSKSLDNFYTVGDIKKQGFDPLALRYLYLQTHYRQEMNFTFASLKASQNALNKLRIEYLNLKGERENKEEAEKYRTSFFEAVNDDLNMPKALAIVWEMLKKDLSDGTKRELLLEFDQILGLNLKNTKVNQAVISKIPEKVLKLVSERESLRKKKKYHLADQVRNKIQKLGFDVEDKADGPKVKLLDKF